MPLATAFAKIGFPPSIASQPESFYHRKTALPVSTILFQPSPF
jgi:hypothetical protein